MNFVFRAADRCAKRALLVAVGLVSGFFRMFGGRACRFYPSCSQYAAEAVRAAGFFKALILIVGRISRCHPFSPGGYDPVSVLHKKEI